MNNIYLETNDNEYIVFENDNKVSKVISNDDIGEILSIENDLEKLKEKIKSKNDYIKYLKKLIKYNKFLDKVVISWCLVSVLIGILCGILSIGYYLSLSVILTSLIKGMSVLTLGTKSKNLNEIHKLDLENIVSQGKIDALTIKLKKRIEKNNYKKCDYKDFKEIDGVLESNKSKAPTVKKLVLKREP